MWLWFCSTTEKSKCNTFWLKILIDIKFWLIKIMHWWTVHTTKINWVMLSLNSSLCRYLKRHVFCLPILSDSSRRVTKPCSLILIRRSVIGRLPFCPLYTRAEYWWTWPTGPRPLSTLTGPQLHQEQPDVTVVMRCWDLWQMNKSNLSVADRGAIDLSGVRAALLLMTLFPVNTHLTSDPAWEINEFDSDGRGFCAGLLASQTRCYSG